MDFKIIGERIKELRIYNSLTQVQLAEKLKTSQSLLHRWESGKRFVSVPTLVKLSKIFNTSLDQLVFSDKDIQALKAKDKSLATKLKDFDKLSEQDKQTVANLISSLAKNNED